MCEMKYTKLGKSDLFASKIILGCGFRGIERRCDAVNVIDYAIDSGINFIDCANVYKLRNQEFAEFALGEAIKNKRNKVIISSKVGAPLRLDNNEVIRGASMSTVNKCLEMSLKRLNTDWLDLYLLHGPDSLTSTEEIVETFDSLCKSGKIRYYGLCNHSAEQVSKLIDYAALKGYTKPVVLQNSYNLINRRVEDELFNIVKDFELGFMAYSPLATGLLSGAYSYGKTPPQKSTWGYDENYQLFFKYLFPGKIKKIVDLVQDIADRNNTSCVTVATSWIISNSNVSVSISGADNSAELQDSINSINFILNENEKKTLNEITKGMNYSLTNYEVSALVSRFK